MLAEETVRRVIRSLPNDGTMATGALRLFHGDCYRSYQA